MTDTLLFAYGTLLTGAADPGIAALVRTRCRRLGVAWVRGRLFDLGPYPALVGPDRPADRVYGELLALPEPAALLARLDRFEGYDPAAEALSLYLRRPVTATRLPQGRALRAWAYFYNRPLGAATRVAGGDYPRHLRRRRRSGSPRF